jgi:hypothetical protein
LILFACAPAFATNHAVVPSCANNGNGTNWSCASSSGGAGAYNAIPTTLTRGDIYYLADGTYGYYQFDTATSGTTTVEIRKAQSYDYGGLSGFNASTMGSSQAVFPWTKPGSIFTISGSYLIINGNSNDPADTIGCGGVLNTTASSQTSPAPSPSGCGIKIDNSRCTSTATNYCSNGSGIINGGGTSVIWKSVEWEGSDINANEPYFWLSSLSASGEQVTHSYLHAFGTTCWTYGFDNANFTYNYVWGTNDSSINHGECLQDTGSDGNMVIAYNVFRDTITNGDLVFVDPSPGTHDAFVFANNVIWCTSSSGCRHNDGIIACINSSQTCTNFLVYNNTIINCAVDCGLNSTNAGSYTWENNLWYNSPVVYNLNGSAFRADYNSYLKSGTPGSGSHDVNNTSSSVPFANWSTANATLTGPATLASAGSSWNNRVSLGSPFDTDAAGNAYASGSSGTRGAYQSGGAATPAAPTNLTATPH